MGTHHKFDLEIKAIHCFLKTLFLSRLHLNWLEVVVEIILSSLEVETVGKQDSWITQIISSITPQQGRKGNASFITTIKQKGLQHPAPWMDLTKEEVIKSWRKVLMKLVVFFSLLLLPSLSFLTGFYTCFFEFAVTFATLISMPASKERP